MMKPGAFLIFFTLFLIPIAAKADGAADSDGQSQTRHEAGGAIDPAYVEGAAKTGGRVYDMRNPEDMRAFQEELARPQREERRRRWKERWDLTRVHERLPWSGRTTLVSYALLKWLAYAGWCFVGLGLAGKPQGRLARAAMWGIARVVFGILFGVMVFYLFTLLRWAPPDRRASYVAIYLAIYLPVRWVEWSIMARAMGVPVLRWRGGGIAVSCLADVVQMLLFGSLIPVGRFLC